MPTDPNKKNENNAILKIKTYWMYVSLINRRISSANPIPIKKKIKVEMKQSFEDSV